MVEGIAIVLVMSFLIGMATLAMVLLVAFGASAQPLGRTVLIAALGGPGACLLLFAPFALLDTPAWEVLATLGVILLISGAVIGSPIAYFATRRLDRLMRFDSSTFD